MEESIGEYKGFCLTVTDDGHNISYLARKSVLQVAYSSRYGLDDLKRVIDEGEGKP